MVLRVSRGDPGRTSRARLLLVGLRRQGLPEPDARAEGVGHERDPLAPLGVVRLLEHRDSGCRERRRGLVDVLVNVFRPSEKLHPSSAIPTFARPGAKGDETSITPVSELLVV